MKKGNVLALAISASVLLGGAYVVNTNNNIVYTEEEEKAKPSKDKKEETKSAKQKGNNPKTGLVGLAPIYSTLAISMAGIVAARKKND